MSPSLPDNIILLSFPIKTNGSLVKRTFPTEEKAKNNEVETTNVETKSDSRVSSFGYLRNLEKKGIVWASIGFFVCVNLLVIIHKTLVWLSSRQGQPSKCGQQSWLFQKGTHTLDAGVAKLTNKLRAGNM